MHIIQEVTNWTAQPVVLLNAPDAGDTSASKQKLMNTSEKKGDQWEVRRKRKSREEAREDEILAKRIMIEGSDLEKGVIGVNRLATKGEKYYRLPTKIENFNRLPTK